MREGVERAVDPREAPPLEHDGCPGAGEEREVVRDLLQRDLCTRDLRSAAEREERYHELRPTCHTQCPCELVLARAHAAVHALLKTAQLQRHLQHVDGS